LSLALAAGTTFDISTVAIQPSFGGTNRSTGDTHSMAENADFQRLDYDPASGNYTLHAATSLGSPGTTSTLYPSSSQNKASYYPYYGNNPNFTSYATSATNSGLGANELYLYNLGNSNSEIALTYVSFGVQMQNPFAAINQPYTTDGRLTFFIYGVPTLAADMPKTGTASFNGVVWGWASTPAVGSYNAGAYDIHGTSTLTADFGAATLTTSMTFSGTPIANSSQLVIGVPSTTISGTGVIGSPGYQNTVSAGGDAGTFYGSFSNGERQFHGALLWPQCAGVRL
jgi:hypothetical protein